MACNGRMGPDGSHQRRAKASKRATSSASTVLAPGFTSGAAFGFAPEPASGLAAGPVAGPGSVPAMLPPPLPAGM